MFDRLEMRKWCWASCLVVSAAGSPAVADDALAAKAFKVLRERCYNCHGAEQKVPNFHVTERDNLIRHRGEDLDPYVTPGNLDSSDLWVRMGVVRDMPPKKVLPTGLPEAELQIIREWIEAGAPQAVVADRREFISEADSLRRIKTHLFDNVRDAESRRFQRYFSITHLYNNKTVTELDLRLYRAALSKAINSMSRRSDIVVPTAVNPEETIFAIDLRHFGWEDLILWDKVVKAYPYGLKPQDRESRGHYDDIASIYGAFYDGVPYLRADWFITVATRPPLYHELTNIPQTLDELQKRLNVDPVANFNLGTAKRAGVFESGVSGQNRLVEYHSSNTGTYWVSYDFKKDSGRSNLARFPLGPRFSGNKFDREAFEHDGGEIIFTLPNGLHGYMLVTGDGQRIDEGPVEIVWDATNTSGSPLIVNGISCMNCHKSGTIEFADDIREGHALFNTDARDKVEQLYPPRAEAEQVVREGRLNYLRNLRRAIGSFLLVKEDKDKDVINFPEPVSHVARLYDKNLSLEEAARELGYAESDSLKSQLTNKRVQQLGLGPLTKPGGTVKRSFWDSSDSSNSVFQEVAGELGVGSPIN